MPIESMHTRWCSWFVNMENPLLAALNRCCCLLAAPIELTRSRIVNFSSICGVSKGKGRQNFWDFFSHSSSYFAFSFLKISLSLFQCWVTACARRANELAAIQAVGENQSSNNFLCALSRLLAPYTHTAWHTIELKNESHSAVFFFSRDQ